MHLSQQVFVSLVAVVHLATNAAYLRWSDASATSAFSCRWASWAVVSCSDRVRTSRAPSGSPSFGRAFTLLRTSEQTSPIRWAVVFPVPHPASSTAHSAMGNTARLNTISPLGNGRSQCREATGRVRDRSRTGSAARGSDSLDGR